MFFLSGQLKRIEYFPPKEEIQVRFLFQTPNKNNWRLIIIKLEGKVAIITGGAMGIGLGIVRTFLKYKANVVILDTSEELANTLTMLQQEGYSVLGYSCDVRDTNNINATIEDIKTRFGKIDILVNNAGVCKLDSFENTTDELRDFHFDINIKGVWNMSKAVLPYLKEVGKGTIVNLSSVTGPMVADSGEVAYATSKAAVLGFTKGLAREVIDDNIRVNAIMPGYVKTPLVEGMAVESNSYNPNSVIDGMASAIPMKRLATPEEVGELAAFLASDESSYIMGQGIVIDGGSTLPETSQMGV